MCPGEYEAAIETFIRSNGVTPCQRACALPIQTVAAADRVALKHYAERRRQSRRQQIIADN
jgi:hypothetical protein